MRTCGLQIEGTRAYNGRKRFSYDWGMEGKGWEAGKEDAGKTYGADHRRSWRHMIEPDLHSEASGTHKSFKLPCCTEHNTT